MKYEVMSFCFYPERPFEPIVSPPHTDERGTRTEVIDTESNQLFARCKSPWDVEDAYEAFWNRLNGSWETDFPKGKEKVKVISVVRL